MPVTGGDIVYRTLIAAGVEHVFGIVSVHNIPIYDAILRSGGIKPIDVRHEQGALHAADGYARATGKLGVAITSTGPGATNGMTGLFEAGFASSPVLMITGQTETGDYGKGRGVLHEAEQQLPMLRTIARAVASPRRTEDIAGELSSVIRNIMTGRPQPGAIEIPVDLQYAEIEAPTVDILSGAAIEPEASAVQAAGECIAASSRRIIIAGGGVIRSGASQALVSLAELLGAPVFTTINGRGAIPEDHPLSAGAFTFQCRRAIENAETVIAIGTRFQSANTGNGALQLPGKLVHVDADPHMLGLNYRPEVAIAGDAGLTMAALMDAGNFERGDQAFTTSVLDAAEEMRQGIRERMGPDFEAIMDSIRAALPGTGHIVRDATIPAYVWGNSLIPILGPRTSHHSTSAAIGPGLPLAIGAAIGTGEKAVVIQGDGGFMLNLSELATAVQYQVPVIVCLFNDRGYGILRRIQSARFDGRMTGVDLATPDFVKLAEAMGMKGIRVKGREAFAPAFDEALNVPGPVLLDIDANSLARMKMGGG